MEKDLHKWGRSRRYRLLNRMGGSGGIHSQSLQVDTWRRYEGLYEKSEIERRRGRGKLKTRTDLRLFYISHFISLYLSELRLHSSGLSGLRKSKHLHNKYYTRDTLLKTRRLLIKNYIIQLWAYSLSVIGLSSCVCSAFFAEVLYRKLKYIIIRTVLFTLSFL